MPYGRELHIPPTNYHLLAAQQESLRNSPWEVIARGSFSTISGCWHWNSASGHCFLLVMVPLECLYRYQHGECHGKIISSFGRGHHRQGFAWNASTSSFIACLLDGEAATSVTTVFYRTIFTKGKYVFWAVIFVVICSSSSIVCVCVRACVHLYVNICCYL